MTQFKRSQSTGPTVISYSDYDHDQKLKRFALKRKRNNWNFPKAVHTPSFMAETELDNAIDEISITWGVEY